VDLLINLLSCAASGNNPRGYNRNGIGLEANRNSGKFAYGGIFLLFCFIYLLASSPTKSFEPFPHNMGFNHKDGSQDIDLLLETLDMIPSVKEMSKCAR
jgi:hypothetical protein